MYHEEFTSDTTGISQDERIIQETKGISRSSV